MNRQTNTKPMETPHSTPSADADRCGAETRDDTPCQKYPAGGGSQSVSRRADVGLAPRSVTRTKLKRIADTVAGVARRGIQALRAAAELADKRAHERIAEPDVDDCFARARTAIRRCNLSSLTFHHQLLYARIYARGDVASSDLHDWYDDVADQLYRDVPQTPVSKRHRRSLLDKLQAYDLVERGGDHNSPTYHLLDGDVEPEIEPS